MTGKKSNAGITLLGLGPGNRGQLTQEAFKHLYQIDRVYLRTIHLPVVSDLPKHLVIESFDHLLQENENLEYVYRVIVDKILALGQEMPGVTYAVPGHPFIGEATCPDIARRARQAGVPVRVIDGLSFLEPTFRLLEMETFSDLVLVDAIKLSIRQTPGFSPSSSALISQIYSTAMAKDVKKVLMSVYPDDFPVWLVYGAGTPHEKIEDLALTEIDSSPLSGVLSALYIPPLSAHASFEAFQEVIARLRAPDGCPWDREQTHRSLRPFLIEEAYEALEALDLGDMKALEEELGDLLLQILLHAQIASEAGEFNIHHVLKGIATKLIRRHPHVFSEVSVEDVAGVIQNWEEIKADERKENGDSEKKGLLDGVPLALPALLQAQEIIERVQRVGLNPWQFEAGEKELQDTLDQLLQGEEHPKAELFGKLLFKLTALAHSQNIDAESVLREALTRFRSHLGEIESSVLASGKSLSGLSKAERVQLWSGFNFEETEQ